MGQRIIDEALLEAKQLGIRNILALRGDAPREYEYGLEEQEEEGGERFVWAVDLVRYIRKIYGDYFCIGVAGYPEGHSDLSYPFDQNVEHDMPYLVEKVQAGADFIMTQLFYNVDAFFNYEKLVRSWDGGVLKDIPIIPGLMPIQNYQTLKRITKLSHAKLPPEILDRLEPVKGDDEAVKRVGVEIISEIVHQIQETPSPNLRGFHFFTLNLEKAVSFIVEQSQLIPPMTPEEFDLSAIDDSPLPLSRTTGSTLPNHHHHHPPQRRPSSPHNHLISDSASITSSTTSRLEDQSRATTLAITHGVGSLGREATWDDYPNGRFGDARSPAFGEIDGYGLSIHLSPIGARAKWGLPTSRAHIGALFKRHVMGDLDQLPWCEGNLSDETKTIRTELGRLIDERGWWSVASQPAVDGVPSADPVFGWGPKGGFVFQKAFVEFFIPAADWRDVLRPILTSAAVAPEVSWYAASSPCWTSTSTSGSAGSSSGAAADPAGGGGGGGGAFEASVPSSAVNSVTWGAFPGKEIVTPTIVEEVSFRAWVEEAFGIWREWERCYMPGSATRAALRAEREGGWLVNVIGHGYREQGRLWEILLDL